MFGLTFLFSAALWALPLAALPIILHLLFRRKSPVVQFSTLRFIKASIQRTAARKRVQRWLLLACRALLIALLVWAVAQPAKMLASGWFGGGESMIAAIVVDTRYSMQLQDGQETLLSKADDTIQDLLRGDLKNAKVAIFRSQPAPRDIPEQLEEAAKIQGEWTPLKPQASAQPLVDRIAAAVDLLKRQDAAHKWLIILTDLQRKEFPRPVADFKDGRVILIDLHPDQPRSDGITKIASEPAQPRPGVGSEALVEITGHAGDSREVKLQLTSIDGNPISSPALPMAKLDAGGRVSLRTPLKVRNEPWLLLKASLPDDAMAWDNQRQQLLRIPPAEPAALLPVSERSAEAESIIRRSLDPFQGAAPWSIALRPPGPLKGDETIVAAALTSWPDEATARQLGDFVRRGGTLILFLQPGLEQAWPSLPAPEKQALLTLLPGSPSATHADQGPYRASVAKPDDPLLAGVGDVKLASGKLIVTRVVPFDALDPSATSILNAAPDTPTATSRLRGLTWRKSLAGGTVITWATFPSALYGNLRLSELFLPMMVNSTLHPDADDRSLNVELGSDLVLSARQADNATALEIETPVHEKYRLAATDENAGRRFVFSGDKVAEPGLYAWRRPGDDRLLAWTNVQLPSGESQLEYRSASEVLTPGPDVLVARSLPELQNRMVAFREPEAHWSGAIAIVLFLLCLEALMGSASRRWKPALPRFFVPTVAKGQA